MSLCRNDAPRRPQTNGRGSLRPGAFSHNSECLLRAADWSVKAVSATRICMGEHIEHQGARQVRIARNRPGKQTAETIGRRLLAIIVYGKSCRIGAKLSLDELADSSEVGDWKMPDFRLACRYAASQGWLVVDEDSLTLTTAGLAAA